MSSLISDPSALRDTVLITGVATLTLIGLLSGLKELSREIRAFRKVKA